MYLSKNLNFFLSVFCMNHSFIEVSDQSLFKLFDLKVHYVDKKNPQKNI